MVTVRAIATLILIAGLACAVPATLAPLAPRPTIVAVPKRGPARGASRDRQLRGKARRRARRAAR